MVEGRSLSHTVSVFCTGWSWSKHSWPFGHCPSSSKTWPVYCNQELCWKYKQRLTCTRSTYPHSIECLHPASQPGTLQQNLWLPGKSKIWKITSSHSSTGVGPTPLYPLSSDKKVTKLNKNKLCHNPTQSLTSGHSLVYKWASTSLDSGGKSNLSEADNSCSTRRKTTAGVSTKLRRKSPDHGSWYMSSVFSNVQVHVLQYDTRLSMLVNRVYVSRTWRNSDQELRKRIEQTSSKTGSKQTNSKYINRLVQYKHSHQWMDGGRSMCTQTGEVMDRQTDGRRGG